MNPLFQAYVTAKGEYRLAQDTYDNAILGYLEALAGLDEATQNQRANELLVAAGALNVAELAKNQAWQQWQASYRRPDGPPGPPPPP